MESSPVRRQIPQIGSLLTLLFLTFPFGMSNAADYLVRPDGTGDYPTIQAAYDAAVDGDAIVLDDGTFLGTGNRALSLSGKDVTLRSVNGIAADCILDLEGFVIGDADPPFGGTFENITFRNGLRYRCVSSVAGFHGCVFENAASAITAVESSSVEVHDCLFTGGTGAQVRGAVEIYRSVFSQNNDEIALGWSFLFEDCDFTDNTCDPALINVGSQNAHPGDLQMTRCRFLRNTAVFGMVASHDTNLTCDGCTFAENSGFSIYWFGFGIIDPIDLAVRSSTFADNGTPEDGHLLIDTSQIFEVGMITIDNSIFAFNEGGAGIACIGDGVPELTCCDVHDNEGGDWVGCIAGQFGISGNIAEDPLFCRENGESPYMLQEASPCAPFSPPNTECDLIGAWGVGCLASGIEDAAFASLPHTIRAAPNPFRTITRIVLPEGIPIAPGARFEIFDTSGRLVHQIDLNRRVYAGDPMIWDGTDLAGRALPSGIYYGKLRGTAGGNAEPILVVR